MGTSQSKRDAPPAAPLIPPWADQDPPPIPPAPDPNIPLPVAEPSVPPVQPVLPLLALAEPRRYAVFRTGLRRYATSGDPSEARVALGHWARTSTGGAKAGAARVGRAARTGGAALAGFGRAGVGLSPVEGALDIRTLA